MHVVLAASFEVDGSDLFDDADAEEGVAWNLLGHVIDDKLTIDVNHSSTSHRATKLILGRLIWSKLAIKVTPEEITLDAWVLVILQVDVAVTHSEVIDRRPALNGGRVEEKPHAQSLLATLGSGNV